MFACLFGWYRYKWLLCGAAPADDMFQRKINKIFNDMPNVFGITVDILIIGYEDDGSNHDDIVQKVQRCRKST